MQLYSGNRAGAMRPNEGSGACWLLVTDTQLVVGAMLDVKVR